ncbi:TRAF3-interacting protein 1-like isoform X2 [Saccostrea cucullata]|uniref:TRAF3-interacting protein 1-like isoform X2 n=1 Tax=Saccostrea cuccullata TaxID=36930 RepID=UPI002ED38094
MDARIVKKTQDTLGKIIKKPPLTEKLLNKPPFRFLHDIVTSVIKTTGFMNGLFKEEELNSENVKDKDSKIAFLQKAIDFTSMVAGKSLSVKPAKIVAGHEPEKTNEFLQALAAAINKGVDNDEYVAKMNKGGGEPKEEKRDKSKEGSREDRKKRDSEDKKDRDKSASREKSRERHRDKEERHKDREDRHRDDEDRHRDKKDRHRDKEGRHRDKEERDGEKEERHKDREERHRERKERRKAQIESLETVGAARLDSDNSTASDIDQLDGLSQNEATELDIESPPLDTSHMSKHNRPGAARPRASRQREMKVAAESYPPKEEIQVAVFDGEQSTQSSSEHSVTGEVKTERNRMTGTKSRMAVRQRSDKLDPHQGGTKSRAARRPAEIVNDDPQGHVGSKIKGQRTGIMVQVEKNARLDPAQTRVKDEVGGSLEQGRQTGEQYHKKPKESAGVQFTQSTKEPEQEQSPVIEKSPKEGKHTGKVVTKEGLLRDRKSGKRGSPEQASPKFIPRKQSRIAFDQGYMERKIREKKRQGSMYSIQRDWKRAERAMHSREIDRQRGTSRKESDKETDHQDEESKENDPSQMNGEKEESPTKLARPSSAKGSRRRREEDEPPKTMQASEGGEENLPPQVSASRSLARPSSARPAPPRRKQEVIENEPAMRLGSGKPSNVIVDGGQDSDEDEDETFMVEETAAPQEPEQAPPPQQDEDEEEDHGGLVKKMLETKKELESGSQVKKTEIERPKITDAQRMKQRQQVQKEIDKLRVSIQTLTRSANPLGKVMDYVQEDLDSMQKELQRWKQENKEHSMELKRERSITDKAIEPLRAQLTEVDQAIKDQLDLIAAVKSNIIRNDQKIDKMLRSIAKS